MSKIILKIYVAGLGIRNKELIAAFRQACMQRLDISQYEVLITDILKYPVEAEQRKVLACPTIIRERPFPEKRIIGDLRDSSKSLTALDFLIEDLTNQK